MAAANQNQKGTKNSICCSHLDLQVGVKRCFPSALAMASEYSVSFDQVSSHVGLIKRSRPHQAQNKLSY